MSDSLEESALAYHSARPAGKLTVTATKPLANQVDLSQAYSPGVAYPCMRIAKDPLAAAMYTARSNLVGVITNGSAVLGLGNIGPLAAKPVMEGKAVLFKKFSNIDAFDIEVDETDPQDFIEAVSRLEPTFGAINLEDIKAPECFVIELEAAVIGVPHPKWLERPLMIVVPEAGDHPEKKEILDFMTGKIVKWWIPDDVVFVDEIPHTATGKISKLRLREQFKDYAFPA